MVSLAYKTAFVTGGAKGLGKAYIQRFLEEGANVFYGDVNEVLGKSTQQELQTKYGEKRVMFFPFDVTNHEKFKEAFALAVSRFDHVDIFVNNAGVLNESIWEPMIEINFNATIFGTNLAMDHMRKDKGGKGGRIINISSLAGLSTYPAIPVYCGTKHAVRAFTTAVSTTQGLQSDMGIEIAILCPDVTKTDLVTELDDTKYYNHTQAKSLLDDLMMPVSIVADALFFLLHKEDINGAILQVLKEGPTFQKMEKVDLGTDWPQPKDAL